MSSRSSTATRARSGGADGLGDAGADGVGADGSALTGNEFEGASGDGDGAGVLVSDGSTEPTGAAEQPIATITISAMNAEVRNATSPCQQRSDFGTPTRLAM